MKKLALIFTICVGCFGIMEAQNCGGIIHTVFQPDSVVNISNYYGNSNKLYLDFNQDDDPDLQFYFYNTSVGNWRYVGLDTESNDSTWMWSCRTSTDWASPYETPLSNIQYGTHDYCWRSYYDENDQYHMDSIMHGAVKYTKDGNSYYGWFLAYTGRIVRYMAVKEMAFCTIPNYPLVWGQTEIVPQPAIIYNDYEPDTTITLEDHNLHPESVFNIDADFDGTPDFYVYYVFYSASFVREVLAYSPEEWEIKAYHHNDSLIPLTQENGWLGGISWQDAYIYEGNDIVLDLDRFAVRHKVGNDYYYGWFRAYPLLQPGNVICLDKKAWCTIPNYPLIWGQTTMENIGEDGSEWYYEIENNDGTITYQHLECVGDTLFENGKRPKIIIRSNTQYDRNEIIETTREYIYEENGKVYWWNFDLQEFTTLYDFAANTGDVWEIKVGTGSITMHVDAVESIEYEGNTYRMLRVSDENDLFSGTIVCGIGHLTSFFPERLMNRSKGYRVEGMRCYWVNGVLTFKIGDEDCDKVYQKLHDGITETNGSGAFEVYPNPTTGVLFIRLPQCDSPTATENEYHIINLTGQTLLRGTITAENQQINIEKLPAGMYFISLAGETQKFIKGTNN